MIPLVILGISFLTHFIALGHPASVVFDEVFYGRFMSDYWQNIHFFDQHPPFFKLLMTGIGYLSGASRHFADWTSIGNPVPDEIIILRIIPLVAGTLLPLVIYALCRRLDFSKAASVVAGLLVCLETSLLIQSRFILPDVVMLLTGFASILLYMEWLRSETRHPRWFLIASILCMAATVSTKWTGLAFLLVIFAMEAYRRPSFKRFAAFVGAYLGIIFIFYALLFAIHFSLIKNPGQGDAFMTAEFQSKGFAGKFIELNHVMFAVNHAMTATHSYSSKWYTWPLMQRTVFYWESPRVEGKPSSYLYYFGNPVIYWLGTLAVCCMLLQVLVKRRLNKVSFFILLGFLVNLLPFAFIGRVMFLYHYEAALIFSIIALVYLLEQIKAEKKRIAVATAIVALALAAFAYWSPLIYGTPLTEKGLANRMWMPTWR